MRLSWRDFVTTVLAISGGAIVYAKFYEYSWAMIGSWRSAAAMLTGIGLLMVIFSAFDVSNGSVLNMGEMLAGIFALLIALIGISVTSSPVFYILATTLGVMWFVDTSRHVRHSLLDDIGQNSTTFRHHYQAH